MAAGTDNIGRFFGEDVFIAFGATWGMPLLFTISGMGVWYSLGSRGAAAFARERLRRLGVPLLTGLLTLVPLQVYLGLRRAGDTTGAARFYARFWDVRPSLDFPFVLKPAPGGLFETGHLWFLVCLLGFSLVLSPGLTLLRQPRGAWAVELAGGPCAIGPKRKELRAQTGRAPMVKMSRMMPPTPVAAPWKGSTALG